jgi:hypothetical protein
MTAFATAAPTTDVHTFDQAEQLEHWAATQALLAEADMWAAYDNGDLGGYHEAREKANVWVGWAEYYCGRKGELVFRH